ncbi:MAG: 3-methyl-2-oxobutanoate dehydrogenase subunit VorB [Kiritimatiellia bacterium]|nr:3-methyl-2-oxobutanoate dehydrogenase subunit VorB [Lentisphaerota bacterium]
MTGNEALAEGAIRAGCQCYFGYPITPQNELTAYMSAQMPARGRVFIQSESELAAISMVFGAAAAGARAMTTSSSPGISLMQEGLSYLAGARLPAVVVNVQRGGPGLGSIDPAQGDYFQSVKSGGHGDYHMIVLAPTSVQEMHDLTIHAFRLADCYRVPVMVLADGRIGQMMEPIRLHEGPPPPAPRKPWALTGAAGRDPNCVRSLLVGEGELEQHNYVLQDCYRHIRRKEIMYHEKCVSDCETLLVAWGTCARLARGVVDLARAKGKRVGLLQPTTLWPFPEQRLRRLAARVKNLLVVEMNCGQMLEDVQRLAEGRAPVHFKGYPGGRVPTETEILRAVMALRPPRSVPRRKTGKRK